VSDTDALIERNRQRVLAEYTATRDPQLYEEWMDNYIDTEYCDDCGDELTGSVWYMAVLIKPVTSANVGESAQLCPECGARQVEGEQ
jgi:hypothetical protein